MNEGTEHVPNPILRWYRILRPQLWDAEEFEQLAFVLGYSLGRYENKSVSVGQVCEAMAELQPSRREFWLRVEATE